MLRELNQFLKLIRLGFLRFRSKDDYRKMQSFIAQASIEELEKRGICLENKEIVEFGSGRGGYSEIFHQKSNKFLASDLIKDDIFTNNKIPFLEMSLANPLPIESNTYDFIYCSSVIEHLENPVLMLQEAFRILKNNGHMLLSFPPFYSLSLVGGHHFKPFHFLGEKCAVKLTNLILKEKFTNYATTYGSYGLHPLTMGQVKTMIINTGFEIKDIYTRNFPINTVFLPGFLKDLMTWHACYLIRKSLKN